MREKSSLSLIVLAGILPIQRKPKTINQSNIVDDRFNTSSVIFIGKSDLMDLFLFNAGPARKYTINMETSELQHLDFFLGH